MDHEKGGFSWVPRKDVQKYPEAIICDLRIMAAFHLSGSRHLPGYILVSLLFHTYLDFLLKRVGNGIDVR